MSTHTEVPPPFPQQPDSNNLPDWASLTSPCLRPPDQSVTGVAAQYPPLYHREKKKTFKRNLDKSSETKREERNVTNYGMFHSEPSLSVPCQDRQHIMETGRTTGEPMFTPRADTNIVDNRGQAPYLLVWRGRRVITSEVAI